MRIRHEDEVEKLEPRRSARALRWAALALSIGALVACRDGRGPEAASASLTSTSGGARCDGIRLSSGLDLVVLGSGGPRSAGRTASSYLLAVGGTPRVLVDAGPGSFARLGETGLPADKLDILLLTHLHIDHAGDVPGIVKSRDLSGDRPVGYRVFGPTARGPYPKTSTFVDRLFGDEGVFAYLPSFRNELDIRPTDLPIDLAAGPRVILEEGDLVVSTVAVDHGEVPAVAYRVELGGRSVVVSGDLASKRGRIEDLARGADVLVYDAAVLDPPGSPQQLYDLHTPPRRIGEVAAAAGVRTLLLSHVPPAVDARRAEVLASVRASFAGDVRFAHDCMHVAIGGAR